VVWVLVDGSMVDRVFFDDALCGKGGMPAGLLSRLDGWMVGNFEVKCELE
jgi:hypothetical protein